LTSDTTDGFAFTVLVNLGGTTSVTNFSTQIAGLPSAGSVPEPRGLALALGTGMAIGLWALRPRRRLRG